MWCHVRVHLDEWRKTWSVSADIQKTDKFLHPHQLLQSRTGQPQGTLWFWGMGMTLIFLDDFNFIACSNVMHSWNPSISDSQQAAFLGRGGHPVMADEADEAMWLQQKRKLEGSHKITAGMQNMEVHLGRGFCSEHQLLKTRRLWFCRVVRETWSKAMPSEDAQSKIISIPEKHLFILN